MATLKTISILMMALLAISSCEAFSISSKHATRSTVGRLQTRTIYNPIWMSNDGETTKDDSGVIELADTESEEVGDTNAGVTEDSAVAPFLSQGEIQEETLKVDLSDPKQTRVIIYIILSLLPVLFLIPLMLGSREFLPAIIPMEDIPPVQM